MNTTKEIKEAFQEIELLLVEDMKKEMLAHTTEEITAGFKWNQWEAEMLKGLEIYIDRNKKRLPYYYNRINKDIEDMLKTSYKSNILKSEAKILNGILKGTINVNPNSEINKKLTNVAGKTLKDKIKNIKSERTDISFFQVNERKMNELIDESLGKIKTAEATILRTTSDIYRDTILKANVYVNSGAGTLYQAIDMATKDFLAKGITNITYKNGRKVNIANYAEMELRTSNKRAFLQGDGELRQSWGISLILVSSYCACSPICQKWQGKVYIDDVWSNGKPDGKHILLSDAIRGGLYHPNCKHTHSTYFEGISTPPTYKNSSENNLEEQRKNYNNYISNNYKRMAAGSIDENNVKKYKQKEQEWKNKNKEV